MLITHTPARAQKNRQTDTQTLRGRKEKGTVGHLRRNIFAPNSVHSNETAANSEFTAKHPDWANKDWFGDFKFLDV